MPPATLFINNLSEQCLFYRTFTNLWPCLILSTQSRTNSIPPFHRNINWDLSNWPSELCLGSPCPRAKELTHQICCPTNLETLTRFFRLWSHHGSLNSIRAEIPFPAALGNSENQVVKEQASGHTQARRRETKFLSSFWASLRGQALRGAWQHLRKPGWISHASERQA